MLKRIDYNGGYLWVDKTSNGIAGWSSTCLCYNTDGRVGQAENNQSRKIVAQTNLSIPNVPYVEFEENIVYKGLQAAWSYLTALGYFNKPSEEGERVEKLLLNALAAQSKGRYSEEDIEAAIHNAQSASNLHTEDDVLISRKFLEQYFKSLNQPPLEIEIEMYNESEYIKNSPTAFYKTYERDGKTYLKRKL